jgi:hypothetical protein
MRGLCRHNDGKDVNGAEGAPLANAVDSKRAARNQEYQTDPDIRCRSVPFGLAN